MFTTSQAGCADAAQQFIQCASRWSLTVSIPKTKGIFVNSPSNVHVSGEAEVEVVSSFTYLGSVIHRDGLVSHYVLNRIAKASRALESLRVSIFENTTLPLRCRRRCAVVLSTLLYGSLYCMVRKRGVQRPVRQ